MLDSAGTLVVEYKYDAWGKPVSVSTLTIAYDTLANLNPFRYRGYVWDEETGRYYLRSRYYNPEWGRFINADVLLAEVTKTLGNNLFCYCSNSVVHKIDNSGRECKECDEGNVRVAYRYYLDANESTVFAQWLSDTAPIPGLTRLSEKILWALENVCTLFVEGSYSKLITLTDTSSNVVTEIVKHHSETMNDIARHFADLRSFSNESCYTIIEIFGGDEGVNLSISVCGMNGDYYPDPLIYKDGDIFDEVSILAIADISNYLSAHFTPQFHGHPLWGETYESYRWNH